MVGRRLHGDFPYIDAEIRYAVKVSPGRQARHYSYSRAGFKSTNICYTINVLFLFLIPSLIPSVNYPDLKLSYCEGVRSHRGRCDRQEAQTLLPQRPGGRGGAPCCCADHGGRAGLEQTGEDQADRGGDSLPQESDGEGRQQSQPGQHPRQLDESGDCRVRQEVQRPGRWEEGLHLNK